MVYNDRVFVLLTTFLILQESIDKKFTTNHKFQLLKMSIVVSTRPSEFIRSWIGKLITAKALC